jgi:hypothetical protein
MAPGPWISIQVTRPKSYHGSTGGRGGEVTFFVLNPIHILSLEEKDFWRKKSTLQTLQAFLTDASKKKECMVGPIPNWTCNDQYILKGSLYRSTKIVVLSAKATHSNFRALFGQAACCTAWHLC